MASRVQEKDWSLEWRFMILLSRTFLVFLETGLAKSFGVLINEMVDRYNTNYSAMAFICSIPSVLMYLLAPVVNTLMATFSARSLSMAGGLLVGLSIISSPFTSSPAVLALCFTITGFGMALTFLPAVVVLNGYFPESFVFYTSLSNFGMPLGAVVLPPLTELSLRAYGYGGACLILGGISLNCIVCGLILRPLRTDSQARSTDIGVREKFLSGYSKISTSEHDECPIVKQTCRDKCGNILKSTLFFREPLFTLIAPTALFLFYVTYSWVLFLLPHAEWLNIPPSRAVYLATMAGISGVVGKIIYLILNRYHYDDLKIFLYTTIISALLFFLDPISSSYWFLSLGAVIQGACVFGIDVLPTAVAKLSLKDKRNLPSALCVVYVFSSTGTVIGDIFSGLTYDVTGSYTIVFLTLGGIMSITALNFIVYIVVDRYCKKSQTAADDELHDKCMTSRQ